MEAFFLNIEWIAVVFALAYVLLAIYQSPWCWAASIVGAGLYTGHFYYTKLYMESGLQLVYVVMAFYGIWCWTKKDKAYLSSQQEAEQGSKQGCTSFSQKKEGVKKQKRSLVVTSRTKAWHLRQISLIILMSLGVGWLLDQWTQGQAVYLDSFTTIASLFTTYMVANKIAENWLYWVGINGLYVYLFYTTGHIATAGLYFTFLLMACYGYKQWTKQRDGAYSTI